MQTRMEKHSWINWRIKMEGVVNDLKETVKEQATKLELLEETVKVQRDRLDKLEAEPQFPSRNSNFENPVVRLVSVHRLPAENKGCTSEDAVTVEPVNKTCEEQEIECICTNEETGLIPESLAITAEKRKISEAERSRTGDCGHFDEETADKRGKLRGQAVRAAPGGVSVVGKSKKEPSSPELRTDNLTSTQNKKCVTSQDRSSTSVCQPESEILANLKSGPRKKGSTPPRHKCMLCLKTFASFQKLETHIRGHTGEKPFECNVCRKWFAHADTLTVHLRTHTEKPFKCEGCPKSFNYKSIFVKHNRLHTGEKPFTCNFCNKGFRISADLDNHIRIHTGERPYKCLICGADFRELILLKEHKKSAMRFNCTVCVPQENSQC